MCPWIYQLKFDENSNENKQDLYVSFMLTTNKSDDFLDPNCEINISATLSIDYSVINTNIDL